MNKIKGVSLSTAPESYGTELKNGKKY